MTAKKRSPAKAKTAASKQASAKKATSAGQKPARLSALDAAARVLAKAKEPLSCRQLIQIMAEQGLWKSPAGATPDRTLYSAMLKEVATKGDQSRFVRVERGRFARQA